MLNVLRNDKSGDEITTPVSDGVKYYLKKFTQLLFFAFFNLALKFHRRASKEKNSGNKQDSAKDKVNCCYTLKSFVQLVSQVTAERRLKSLQKGRTKFYFSQQFP